MRFPARPLGSDLLARQGFFFGTLATLIFSTERVFRPFPGSVRYPSPINPPYIGSREHHIANPVRGSSRSFGNLRILWFSNPVGFRFPVNSI
jgi:hypothetical protein